MAEYVTSPHNMIVLLRLENSREASRAVENHASLTRLWASSGDESLLLSLFIYFFLLAFLESTGHRSSLLFFFFTTFFCARNER